MKTVRFATFFSAILLCVVLVYGTDSPHTTTTESTTSIHTTTSTEPITTTTTAEPITTTAEPITTTVLPTTAPPTTVLPTTAPPTTAPPTTISPTTEPSSTSNAPVTTEDPTKPPTTHKGTWNVTEGNNVICIRAELEVLFTIPVKGKDYYIALSPDAKSDKSSCDSGNGTQTLVLEGLDYTLAFVFQNDSSKTFVQNITLRYALPVDADEVYDDSKLFPVKVGNSYLCKTSENLMLSNVTMQLKHVQIEAYGKNNSTDFSFSEECKADDKIGNAVPIAVGCALIALIVVVLIAYLVGRQRRSQKGYQSV